MKNSPAFLKRHVVLNKTILSKPEIVEIREFYFSRFLSWRNRTQIIKSS